MIIFIAYLLILKKEVAHIHLLHCNSPMMLPAKELLLHLLNLVAVASFLSLATSRDTALLYSAQFNHMPVHMSQLSGQQWLDESVNRHNQRLHNRCICEGHSCAWEGCWSWQYLACISWGTSTNFIHVTISDLAIFNFFFILYDMSYEVAVIWLTPVYLLFVQVAVTWLHLSFYYWSTSPLLDDSLLVCCCDSVLGVYCSCSLLFYLGI